ncbi:hypothetical protein JMJ77_0008236, partial [Colletotrichum scovillei]
MCASAELAHACTPKTFAARRRVGLSASSELDGSPLAV